MATKPKTTKNRRGRPPVDSQLIAFSFRLTEEERAEYQSIADDVGINLASWMRMSLKDASRRHKQQKEREK